MTTADDQHKRFAAEAAVGVASAIGLIWSAFNEAWVPLACFVVVHTYSQVRLFTGSWIRG